MTPELLEVGDLLRQPLQGAREQVHIVDGAEHLVGLEPVRAGLALGIERLEFRRPVEPGLGGQGEDFLQVIEEVVAIAVELEQETEEVRKVRGEALAEGFPFGRAGVGSEARVEAGADAFEGAVGFTLQVRHVGHCSFPPSRFQGCDAKAERFDAKAQRRKGTQRKAFCLRRFRTIRHWFFFAFLCASAPLRHCSAAGFFIRHTLRASSTICSLVAS